MPPKSAREIVKLVKQIGVRSVILRYVDSAGNLKEIMVDIDVLPEDGFDNGIKLTDLTAYSSVAAHAVTNEDIKMIYPDKQSAFLNPFQDNPSLACLCYLQKRDAAKPSPSNFLNSGSLTSRLLMFSPANMGDFSIPNQFSTPSFGSNLMFSSNFGPVNPLPPSLSQTSLPPQPPVSLSNDTFAAAAAGKMPPPFAKSSGIMMTPMSPMKMTLPPPPLPSFGNAETADPALMPIHSVHAHPPSRDQSPDIKMKAEYDSPMVDHRGSVHNMSNSSSNKARKHQGTSCHQCKNARSLDQLAFCNNSFNKRTGPDKRQCRKKFCQTCLKKFYNDSVENSKTIPGWLCPSCKGICTCAACTRREPGSKRERSPGGMEDENYEDDYSHHVHSHQIDDNGFGRNEQPQSELPITFPPALTGSGGLFNGVISPSLNAFGNGGGNRAFSLGLSTMDRSGDMGVSMMEPLYPPMGQLSSQQTVLSGKKRTAGGQEARAVGRPRKKQSSPKKKRSNEEFMDDDDSE